MGDQDKSWVRHIRCITCVRLLTCCTWFASNAVRCSHCLDGIKRPYIGLLLCLADIMGIVSKSHLTVKYPDLPSAVTSLPYKEELPVPKSPENLTVSDDNSDCGEDHGQQEGDNVDCDPTFEASCSSFEQLSLIQGVLNELARDLNLSTK